MIEADIAAILVEVRALRQEVAELRNLPAAIAADGYLSALDAASFASVSTKTIARAVGRGELHAARVGGRLRLRRADLTAWIERGEKLLTVDEAQAALAERRERRVRMGRAGG